MKQISLVMISLGILISISCENTDSLWNGLFGESSSLLDINEGENATRPSEEDIIPPVEAGIIYIRTAEELSAIRNALSKHYVIINDIDMSKIGTIEPIGMDGSPFTGILDGRGKTIRGMNINELKRVQVGLFGNVKGAMIYDLVIEKPHVSGKFIVGALAGQVRDGKIERVFVRDGMINGQKGLGEYKEVSYTGGMVGSISNTLISSCGSQAVVEGTGTEVGGMVGMVSKQSSIINSSASGEVMSEGTAGGLAGVVTGNSSIENSYASVVTKANEDVVGALVGFLNESSIIENSYATKEARGNHYVGGLVGHANNSVIKNCYSVSLLSGGSYSGGFVGANSSAISASYFDLEKSKTQISIGLGRDRDGVYAYSKNDLTGTNKFFEWNFDEIWYWVGKNKWPILQWQIVHEE